MGSLLSFIRMITRVIFVSLITQSLCRAQTGTIISENYPDNYPDNVSEKRTTIKASNPEDILEIKFLDFKLEGKYGGSKCYDWLQIKGGDGSVLLDETCETDKPRPVTSNTNTAVIIFHSDSYTTDKGYKISWESKAKGNNAECTCGQANEKKTTMSRISGGARTTPHRFPWMVRIRDGCRGFHSGVCGGSLVSPKVVLSAYHCAARYGRYYDDLCDPSDIKSYAYLGMHRADRAYRDYEERIPIIRTLHPANANIYLWGNQHHDFLMYVLEKPAKYTNKVSPICLQHPNAEFGGQKATAAGWGRTDPPWISKKQSRYLKSVELTVSPRKLRHTLMFGTILEEKNGVYQDPCSGDSGGPLMFYNETASKYVLIGTVQGKGYDCRTGKVSEFEGFRVGVWNKVSAHMDWIQERMNALGEKLCI